MWSKKEIAKLDKWYPPCGECWFCGHRDKRHRLWDAILTLDEPDEFLAGLYNLPIEAIKLVKEIKPYHRSNF